MTTTEQDAPEWVTAYHQRIADLRRELITAHLGWEKTMAPYRDQVMAARHVASPEVTPPDALPKHVLDAYAASMMAAGYSYTLAAVLERAEKLDLELAGDLAALADMILQNGGEEGICADVWPSATGTCKHCSKPIEPCKVQRSHAGCSSGHGYIHRNGGHACEARSDGPYAVPVAGEPSP